jgi:pyruvate/2-oxoglutarate/acetoin dehydrogenase E1 component
MDFMILAADQIVNQAAKWRHMLGGQISPNITIRGIVNRGGEQGAQHSQALHSWFAHIPGLRVVMPSTPKDARDMLIAAAQSMDPVMYIDDRWCYDFKEPLAPAKDVDIRSFSPVIRRQGADITLAAVSYSVQLALSAAHILKERHNIDCEIIDVRQLNPIKNDLIKKSVLKTGRFVAVDGGWSNCGFAGELLAQVAEMVEPKYLKTPLKRITLPEAPAPSSRHLEKIYYPKPKNVVDIIKEMIYKSDA